MYITVAAGKILDMYAGIPVMTGLQRLKITFKKMGKLLEGCTCEDDYQLVWEDFWGLNKSVNVSIHYYDPDTSYMEDILARYYAIGAYLESKDIACK